MVAQNKNQQKNHLSSEEKMESGKSIMPTFILILLFFVFKKNNKVPQNLFILLNIYFPIWFIIYITLILIVLSV